MFAKPSDEPWPKQREACDAITAHLKHHDRCTALLIGGRQTCKSGTAWFLVDEFRDKVGVSPIVKHVLHRFDDSDKDDYEALCKLPHILCIDVVQPYPDVPGVEQGLNERLRRLAQVPGLVVLVMMWRQFATPLEHVDVTIEGFARKTPIDMSVFA